jgi:coenzyme PQQ precursor peptide PqqA
MPKRMGQNETNEEIPMKTWTKPVVCTVDAGFEVTRYLPSDLKK